VKGASVHGQTASTTVAKRSLTGIRPSVSSAIPTDSSPSPLVIGPTSDGDQDTVAVERLCVQALDDAVVAFDARARDTTGQAEFQALPLEETPSFRGDLRVHARENAVQVFDDRHARTEASPHRSQFQPDVAGTDHHQVLRHFAVTQRLRARTDAVAVEYDAGQLGGRAPRRDEDPARRETDLILAVLDDDVPAPAIRPCPV
jgi:hypothetical protein